MACFLAEVLGERDAINKRLKHFAVQTEWYDKNTGDPEHTERSEFWGPRVRIGSDFNSVHGKMESCFDCVP